MRTPDFGPVIELLREGIQEGIAPGFACSIGFEDHVWHFALGRFTYDPASPRVTPDTRWDMASVTKPTCTASAAMLLIDEGRLSLDDAVVRHVADFEGEGKEGVRIEDLLLHCSGLPAYANLRGSRTPERTRRDLLAIELAYETGAQATYSCLGFVTLQQVIQEVSGTSLDRFVRERLFGPLDMSRSGYVPSEEARAECAPTETLPDWRKEIEDERGFRRVNDSFVQGGVHDPIAFLMGGVSGNAGLFSTARDMGRFATAMASGAAPFRAETVSEWTKMRREGSLRTYGWHGKGPNASCGELFGDRSFGHTGFTGTSVWIDPDRALRAVLLSNRVHPTAENPKLTAFRPEFHDRIVKVLT